MILKIKELWIFVVFHSPNSGHGDERPPKAFPGAIDKRTRKFIWVFETVLSGESVWCLGNSHYFSPGGGGGREWGMEDTWGPNGISRG